MMEWPAVLFLLLKYVTDKATDKEEPVEDIHKCNYSAMIFSQ